MLVLGVKFRVRVRVRVSISVSGLGLKSVLAVMFRVILYV